MSDHPMFEETSKSFRNATSKAAVDEEKNTSFAGNAARADADSSHADSARDADDSRDVVVNRSERAYQHLLEQILTARLRAGEWVDRRQVAKELRSSVMPVAEAVQRLTAEGYLVTMPRRGTQVRSPRAEDVRGQLVLRLAIECEAARWYYGAPVRAKAKELLPAAQAADDRAKSPDEAWRYEVEFHRRLMALAGAPALAAEFERTMNLARFYGTELFTPFAANGANSHVALLEKLARAETDMVACCLIRDHIKAGKENVLAPLREHAGDSAASLSCAAARDKASNGSTF